MSFLHEALLVAAAQGFLLCAVLLSVPSGNRQANQLLVAYVGLESLHLLFLYLSHPVEQVVPSLPLRILFGFRYLDGPVLYLYVKALTNPEFRLTRHELKHFAVVALWFVWFAYLSTLPDWWQMTTQELQHKPSTIISASSQSIILVFYSSLALRQVHRHRARIQQALSAVDRFDLRWLEWLLVGMIGVCAIHFSVDLLRLQGVLGSEAKAVTNLVVTALLIYMISIGGLRQPQIFTDAVREALAALNSARESSPQEVMAEAEGSGEGMAEKYRKSGLDESRRRDIWERLQHLLVAEHAYLDNQLDLPSLASQLAVRPQEVSEVINIEYGGSFYDLINQHRVEAAKVLLRETQQRPRKMLDVALSVGFSSQSTFYSRFKKLTGMTPANYRDIEAPEGPLEVTKGLAPVPPQSAPRT
ncbi:helix-turn-helix transcriptional regulator [Parahaliea mediterranea]|uniref:helix-turn-helix transcriptional regulator n=1 Tax=Parahaliea mediterranea TaxID=651086 RepID=UPI000E2EE2BC|nr:helix-turn-helix transcriptional regulator [Parahaliea mediterranea]